MQWLYWQYHTAEMFTESKRERERGRGVEEGGCVMHEARPQSELKI